MMYDLETVRLRSAVRVAKAELRRCEQRYDRNQSADSRRWIARIKAAEERYNAAVEALRLVRDGHAQLPDGVSAAPRAPTFRG